LAVADALFTVFVPIAFIGFAIDAAFRFTDAARDATARLADLMTFLVSVGASSRATPAAATTPRTALVIPMIPSRRCGMLSRA
jgi:hypothetical protein